MPRANISRASKTKSGGKSAVAPCACCGVAPDPSGRPLSITFEQPDVMLEVEPELLETWGGDPFLAIKDVGFFVRVILRVKLTDGFAVNFGTWLETDPDSFRQAWQAWNFPEYADLAIEGYVANAIEPWQLPHALVKATVREMEDVPYLASSDDEVVTRILSDTWPHAEVFKPYLQILASEPPAAG